MRQIIPFLISIAALAAQPSQPSEADRDYAAFKALLAEKPDPESHAKDFTRMSEPEIRKYNETVIRWVSDHSQRIIRSGLGFYADYPGDVRRWEIVLKLLKRQPRFVVGFVDDPSQPFKELVDEPASEAWKLRADGLRREVLASADAPQAVREQVEWDMFSEDFRATSAAKDKGEPHDYTPFRARFAAHLARYQDLDAMAVRAVDYLGALEHYDMIAQARAIWLHQLDSPNASLRKKAAERMKYYEMLDRPFDIAFTAADGRKVDFAQMRGKVVLVDFWATWCGPCIAELPIIKRVYAEYHAKGFEVVGIALENCKLAPSDSPDQAAAKLTKARKLLADFTEKENMPWPQYFDGKFWMNDISVQYSITSIPAMFLLDQTGKVVSTNARGEKLEREVRRLLRL